MRAGSWAVVMFALAGCHAAQPATEHTNDDVEPADAGADAGSVVERAYRCPSGSLELALLDDSMLRLHFVSGEAQTERGYTHELDAFHGPSMVVETESASAWSVRTAALVLEVATADCTFTIEDLSGRTIWSTATPWKGEERRVSLARSLAETERIFGLGERTGKADRRGRVLVNWNSDPVWTDPAQRYGPNSDPLYQSHPFFLSVLDGSATGVYLANTHRTVFDVGKSRADALEMTADGGDIDLFVIDGPRPAEVLERFTRLVGRAPLPPRWALGYHQSRWTYTPESRLLEVAAELRERALPADGLWLDIDHMDDKRVFTWDASAFPEPRELIDALREQGFKVTAIFDPGLKYDPNGGYGAYDRGLLAQAFIRDEDGTLVKQLCWPGLAVFPDFSKPEARDFWRDEVARFVRDSGLLGAWIDMNEPDVFSQEGFPLDVPVAGDGTETRFAELHNVYGSLMARATFDGMLAAHPDQRPFVLTRAGFSGVQRHAAVWTGDAESTWETLAMLPAQLQGMSVSGLVLIGSDVGGFTGGPSPELYARWFELGAFSPFFRSHVRLGAPDQEPWSFGAEVEDAARRLLELRYALLPYWELQVVAASEAGTPVIRPLWWDDAGDAQSFAHEDEFFVGPALLVAPVTAAGATSRAVYLPRGEWVDFHDGSVHDGRATVEVAAPFGRVPLFVRAGSIVPMQAARPYTDAPGSSALFLDLFVGADDARGSLSLYEDDGASLAYRDGHLARTRLELEASARRLELHIFARQGEYRPNPRQLAIRLHGRGGSPSAALVDDQPVSVDWNASRHVAQLALADDGAAHRVLLTW